MSFFYVSFFFLIINKLRDKKTGAPTFLTYRRGETRINSIGLSTPAFSRIA